MEISVIWNAQGNVGRVNDISLLNFTKKLNTKMCCNVKDNSLSKGCLFVQNQSPVWSSRSALGLRLRASASAQTQAAVSEKASDVTSANPIEDIKLYVGLPLDTVSTSNTINHGRAISAGLRALKLLGVAGVQLPLWWGIVENEGPRKYNWTSYLSVVEMARKLGLEVHVSICFHASTVLTMSLPNWVSKIGESDSSIYFADRKGQLYKDCLTWAVDDVPVLDGRSPAEVYREFFENFKSAFDGYMGSTITGLIIGLGPNGELRYPSQARPTPGEFQCYDKNMLADLKSHAELIGQPLWGLGGPHDAPGGFFSDQGGSWETPYGDFFLSWYSGRLTAHGARVLSLAASVFEGSMVKLSAKIPLVQEQAKARSHPSELTAGFYNTDGRDGYGPVLKMLSRNSCGALLTGLGSANGPWTNGSMLGPGPFLARMIDSCRAHGVEVSGENSELSGDFEWIKRNLGGKNEVVRSFTYQRMGAYFFSPEHFPDFTRFVRELNGPGRSLDDVAVEEEESVEPVAGKNLEMQTA